MDDTQGQAAPAPRPAPAAQGPKDAAAVAPGAPAFIAAAPAEPASRKGKVEAVVRKWAADRVANSPLSRSTEAWNHLQEQIPSLVDALVEELG